MLSSGLSHICPAGTAFHGYPRWRKRTTTAILCRLKNDEEISRRARMRDEVMSPFRSVRMFLYPALMASASIAALAALPRLVAALAKSPNAELPLNQVLQGLGIDIAALVAFALLYRVDSKARDVQLAKLNREESLASLRVELPNKKVATLEQMRGSVRFVIVAGPKSHIRQAIQLCKPFDKALLQRRVTIIPLITGDDEDTPLSPHYTWTLRPTYTSEWLSWLSEQKRLANIPQDKPVYLSLRMDGRVRGSGVGFPPWSALVAQLPPAQGIWQGVLDGLDGKI